MAAAKYPNQKTIIIKKTPCKVDFLQISNKEWQDAARNMERSFGAFKLYLYLAANEIDYEKGLSMVDVEKKLGLGKSAYYDAVKKLEDCGYLVDKGRNRFEFYTALSAEAENSREMENSGEAEISARAENDLKVLLSAEPEISAGTENDLNSAQAESGYDTFNF